MQSLVANQEHSVNLLIYGRPLYGASNLATRGMQSLVANQEHSVNLLIYGRPLYGAPHTADILHRSKFHIGVTFQLIDDSWHAL